MLEVLASIFRVMVKRFVEDPVQIALKLQLNHYFEKSFRKLDTHHLVVF